jgi:hypothetical protein
MLTVVGLLRSPSCAHGPRNAPRIGALTETRRRSGLDLRIAHGFATLGTYPLTCLEVDPFQVRAEASSLLAAAEQDFAVEGIRDCRRAAARGAAHAQEAAHTLGAAEGNNPPVHTCDHMDQDDSRGGTRVHLGCSSQKRHDEIQGRSLPPQEEHPISGMVVRAMQQGHSVHRWEAPSLRARQQA